MVVLETGGTGSRELSQKVHKFQGRRQLFSSDVHVAVLLRLREFVIQVLRGFL